MFLKRIISALLCVTTVLTLSGCQSKRPVIEPADGWYCTWSASSTISDLEQVPRSPQLHDNTCRQQIKVSIGGDKIRLTFSNEYGDRELVMESVHIAHLVSAGSSEIDPDTDTAVTFSGSTSVKVPAGKTVTSDEIAFSFDPLDLLAVTTKFGSTPAYPTCHPDAGCTTWVVDGDHVSDPAFSYMELMSSWYFLSRVDTWATAGTEVIACFGDSITDGGSSTYNVFNGWPENLSSILQSDPATQKFSVVNAALGDNSLITDGSTSKSRFEHDVLDLPGVHSVIILIGANDIPTAQYDTSQNLINEYKEMIEACHERGISIYAGTLTPFEGNTVYYSELHEKIRQSVNEFIMSVDSGFDGFVDFSNLLCYAETPSKMQSVYDSGDGLHPNSDGYDVMARAAAEMLKRSLEESENE